MSDIESIGISLVLENGVAEGLRRLERDLALFDRETEQRAAKMQSLAQAHLPRFAAAPTTQIHSTAAMASPRVVIAKPIEASAAEKPVAWLPQAIPRIQQAPLPRLTPSVQRPGQLQPRERGRDKKPAPAVSVPAPPTPKANLEQARPAPKAVAVTPPAKANTSPTLAIGAVDKATKPRIAITTSPRPTPPKMPPADHPPRIPAVARRVTAAAPPPPQLQAPAALKCPETPNKPRPSGAPSVTVSLSSNEADRPIPPAPSRVAITSPAMTRPERPRPAAPTQAVTTPMPKPLATPVVSTAPPPPATAPGSVSPAHPVLPQVLNRTGPPPPAPYSANPIPASRDMAPSAPSPAPDNSPLQGELSIDGAQIGRWLAETVARQAARPPTAARRFNSRMMPNWPGYTN